MLTLLSTTNEPDEAQVPVEQFAEVSLALKIHRGSPATIPESLRQFIQWRSRHGTPPALSRTFTIFYDDIATTAPEDWRLGIACSYRHAITANQWQVHNARIPELTVVSCRVTGDEREIGRILRNMLDQYENRLNTDVHPPFVERHTMFPDVAAHKAQQTVYLPVRMTA